MRNNKKKFWIVIKLDMRQFLHGRPRMLTRDLFAVANLVVELFKKKQLMCEIRWDALLLQYCESTLHRSLM